MSPKRHRLASRGRPSASATRPPSTSRASIQKPQANATEASPLLTETSEETLVLDFGTDGVQRQADSSRNAFAERQSEKINDELPVGSPITLPASSAVSGIDPIKNVIDKFIPQSASARETDAELSSVLERTDITQKTNNPKLPTVARVVKFTDSDLDQSPLLGSCIGKLNQSVGSKSAANESTNNEVSTSNMYVSNHFPVEKDVSKPNTPRRSPRRHASNVRPASPRVRFDSASEDDIFASDLRDQVGAAISLLHVGSLASTSYSSKNRSSSSRVSPFNDKENLGACKDLPDSLAKTVSEQDVEYFATPLRHKSIREKSDDLHEEVDKVSRVTELMYAEESPIMKWASVGRNKNCFRSISKYTSKGLSKSKTSQVSAKRKSTNRTPSKQSLMSPHEGLTPQKRRLNSPSRSPTPGKRRATTDQAAILTSPVSGVLSMENSCNQKSKVSIVHVDLADATPPSKLSHDVKAAGAGHASKPAQEINSLKPYSDISPINVITPYKITPRPFPPGASHSLAVVNTLSTAALSRLPASPDRGIPATSSAAIDSPCDTSDDDLGVMATQPINELVLDGVIAYVDVRTGADNRSELFREQLRALGAVVTKRISKRTTHVVFKDGSKATYDRARKSRLLMVSTLWVEACRNRLERVDESLYPPIAVERYDSPWMAVRIPRTRPMQPRTMEEILEVAAKRCERKRKKEAKRRKEQEEENRARAARLQALTPAAPRARTVEELLMPAWSRQRRGGDDSDDSDSTYLPLRVRLFNRFRTPSGNLNIPRGNNSDSDDDDRNTKVTAAGTASPDLSANHRARKQTSNQSEPPAAAASGHSANHATADPPVGGQMIREGQSETALPRDDDIGSVVTAFSANVVLCSTRLTNDEKKLPVSGTVNEEVANVLVNAEGQNKEMTSEKEANTEAYSKAFKDKPPATTTNTANTKQRLNVPTGVTASNQLSPNQKPSAKQTSNYRRRSARLRKSPENERSRSLGSTYNADQIVLKPNIEGNGARTAPAPRRRRLLFPQESIIVPSEELIQPRTPTSPPRRRLLHLHPAMQPPLMPLHIPPQPKRKPKKPPATTSRRRAKRTYGRPKPASVEDERPIEELPLPRRSSVEFTSRPGAEAGLPAARVGRVVLTNMRSAERETVAAVVQQLGGCTISEKVTAATTHVISGEPRRTVSLLCGLAVGAWILHPAWCLHSLEAARWLPEQRFEQVSDWPGGHARRLTRRPPSLAPVVHINASCFSSTTFACPREEEKADRIQGKEVSVNEDMKSGRSGDVSAFKDKQTKSPGGTYPTRNARGARLSAGANKATEGVRLSTRKSQRSQTNNASETNLSDCQTESPGNPRGEISYVAGPHNSQPTHNPAKNLQTTLPLLKSVGSIFISGQTRPPAESLATLVRLAGGSVAVAGRGATVAVGRPVRGVTTVTELWVLDSVQRNQLLPMAEYVVRHPSDSVDE